MLLWKKDEHGVMYRVYPVRRLIRLYIPEDERRGEAEKRELRELAWEIEKLIAKARLEIIFYRDVPWETEEDIREKDEERFVFRPGLDLTLEQMKANILLEVLRPLCKGEPSYLEGETLRYGPFISIELDPLYHRNGIRGSFADEAGEIMLKLGDKGERKREAVDRIYEYSVKERLARKDAMDLLTELARRCRAEYPLTEREMAAIRRICAGDGEGAYKELAEPSMRNSPEEAQLQAALARVLGRT